MPWKNAPFWDVFFHPSHFMVILGMVYGIVFTTLAGEPGLNAQKQSDNMNDEKIWFSISKRVYQQMVNPKKNPTICRDMLIYPYFDGHSSALWLMRLSGTLSGWPRSHQWNHWKTIARRYLLLLCCRAVGLLGVAGMIILMHIFILIVAHSPIPYVFVAPVRQRKTHWDSSWESKAADSPKLLSCFNHWRFLSGLIQDTIRWLHGDVSHMWISWWIHDV